MKIAVIGAGKMGLPLACQLAAGGGTVTACDRDERLVDLINSGRMPFEEPGVSALLENEVRSGKLHATTDLRLALPEADVVIVLIPVLLDQQRKADIWNIVALTQVIASCLRPGQMVCFETTLPVGTTRQHLQPVLEHSGYRAGAEFDLVFSPERVKSRHVLEHLTSIPKIVGGVSPASSARAAEFYRTYLGAPVVDLGTLEAAEFAKLAGMVYRDVNIALANELAAYAEARGINYTAAVAASNADGEVSLLSPGIGVGGHCTPVYPYFVLEDAKAYGLDLTLPRLARGINDGQAARLLQRVASEAFPLSQASIIILGLGFRPEVKEHTLSSAFQIRDEATRLGARVVLHDPLYSDEEIRAHGFEPLDLAKTASLPSVVVLNTAHRAFAALSMLDLYHRGVRCIVDGRNLWSPCDVRKAGHVYIAPGVA